MDADNFICLHLPRFLIERHHPISSFELIHSLRLCLANSNERMRCKTAKFDHHGQDDLRAILNSILIEGVFIVIQSFTYVNQVELSQIKSLPFANL